MRQFPDEFRRLFSFERDAHQRTLASLIAAESSHRDHPDLRKAVDLAAHIAACRIMWLSRTTGSVPLPATLFPEGTPLAEIVEAFERMHAIWSRYLDELADAELERRFEYTTYTGERYADSVHNVLTQLFSDFVVPPRSDCAVAPKNRGRARAHRFRVLDAPAGRRVVGTRPKSWCGQRQGPFSVCLVLADRVQKPHRRTRL